MVSPKGLFEDSCGGEDFADVRCMRNRLASVARDIPASEVHDTVYARMKAAREELESVIPTSFDTELKKIQDQVRLRFGNRSGGTT